MLFRRFAFGKGVVVQLLDEIRGGHVIRFGRRVAACSNRLGVRMLAGISCRVTSPMEVEPTANIVMSTPTVTVLCIDMAPSTPFAISDTWAGAGAAACSPTEVKSAAAKAA